MLPCEFYENFKDNSEELEFLFFQKICDIEEMKFEAEKNHICPYYQSKVSI